MSELCHHDAAIERLYKHTLKALFAFLGPTITTRSEAEAEILRLRAAASPAAAPPSRVDQAVQQITAAIQTPVHSDATEDGDHFSHQLAVPDAASPTGGRPTPAPTRSDALRALAAELRAHCLLLPRGHLVYINAAAILAVADRLDALAASTKQDRP